MEGLEQPLDLGMAIDEGLARRPVEALLRSAEPIPRGQLQQLLALSRSVLALTKGDQS